MEGVGFHRFSLCLLCPYCMAAKLFLGLGSLILGGRLHIAASLHAAFIFRLFRFWRRERERVFACRHIFEVLRRRQFCQIPLVALIIIVIYPITTAAATSSLVPQTDKSISSFMCPKKLTWGALSQQLARRDIERRKSLLPSNSVNLWLV